MQEMDWMQGLKVSAKAEECRGGHKGGGGGQGGRSKQRDAEGGQGMLGPLGCKQWRRVAPGALDQQHT